MEKFEDYKLFIYLILGVIYFIFKNRKKQPAVKSTEPTSERTVAPIPKRTTLINKGKEIEERTINQDKVLQSTEDFQLAAPIDYDDLLEDEENQITNSAIKDSDKEEQERFGPYVNREQENDYGKLLKNNPESLKQAMVLHEILTPKHF